MVATPRIPDHSTNATVRTNAMMMLKVPEVLLPVANWTASPNPVICSCRYGNRKTTPKIAMSTPSARDS